MIKENITQESQEPTMEELKEEIKKLKEQLEKSQNEAWNLKYDGLTDLGRDIHFFTTVNKKIEEVISDENLEELLEKKGDELTEESLKELENIPLSITGADLGYLGKYNDDPEINKNFSGPHEGGDKILKETANIIQTIDRKNKEINYKLGETTQGFRPGGDEYSLVHDLNKQKALEVVVEFATKQSEIEIPGADMDPTINCGTAHVSEGIEAFIKVIPEDERKEMNLEDKSKRIQRFLTSIADRRAKRAKAFERIFQMAQLIKSDKKVFDRNVPYIRKATFNLDEEAFKKLAELPEDELIKKIVEIVDENLSAEREIEKVKAEIKEVIAIADRDSLI